MTRKPTRKAFDFVLNEMYSGFLPSPQARWCTRKLKIEPFERYVGSAPAFSYIGIRADEQRQGYIPKKPPVLSERPNITSLCTRSRTMASTSVESRRSSKYRVSVYRIITDGVLDQDVTSASISRLENGSDFEPSTPRSSIAPRATSSREDQPAIHGFRAGSSRRSRHWMSNSLCSRSTKPKAAQSVTSDVTAGCRHREASCGYHERGSDAALLTDVRRLKQPIEGCCSSGLALLRGVKPNDSGYPWEHEACYTTLSGSWGGVRRIPDRCRLPFLVFSVSLRTLTGCMGYGFGGAVSMWGRATR